MKISVALASYNGEKHISEQLNSIAAQTLLPSELVVCDDGSTDRTVEIVEIFAKTAPFPVCIHCNQERLGYGANFSKVLSLCSGDLVFICDQDDVWLESKIEKMVGYFNENEEIQLLIHDLEYCKGDLSPIGQTKLERMDGAYDLDSKYVVGMATAVRGRFLEACLPIPSGFSHDAWLHTCANILGVKMIVGDVLALYRRHASNVTGAGLLNTDGKVTAKDIMLARRQRELSPTKINAVKPVALLEWLLSSRTKLVSAGLADDVYLEELIVEKTRVVNSYAERQRLLALPRISRLCPIMRMYMAGGYRGFRGIKSAIKDFIYNR